MRHSLPALAVALLSLSALILGCSSGEKPKETAAAPAPSGPIGVEDAVTVDVTAKVKAIDHATRMVTLVDAEGDEITFVAGPEIRRLNEIRPGDTVAARYRASLLAELRPPTAQEAERPIARVRTVSRTPEGDTPAGHVSDATRVVTTVEGVDVPNMLVTLRGPMGDRAMVRGRNRENVQRLRPGDTIVLTFSESVAMDLQKVGPR